MGERRVLVIGSQCAALPNNQLSFLPRVAQELYEVMTDRERGSCVPALGDDASLLINPTVEHTDGAMAAAMERASDAAATLFLAFIGHGERAEDAFYLLPYDAALPPDSRRAVLVAMRVRELLRRYDRLDGLVLLVDTCYSGLGALQAAKDWPSTIAAAGGRFEVLTAAMDRPAFDGCFSATLVELLRSGDPRLGENLRCDELRSRLQVRCHQQDATYLAFDGRRCSPQGDEGLWLGRNLGRSRTHTLLAGTPAWGQIERLTAWFQLTPQLDKLLDVSRTTRCVAIVGLAGTGKSTLATVLARSEVVPEVIPTQFVHALAFSSPATSAGQLAADLHRQLTLTVPGFREAAEEFQRHTPEEQWRQLDPLTQQLVGPLRRLQPERPVRIVIDGLDQLPAEVLPPVVTALQVLADEPELRAARVIVTARPDTTLPESHHRFDLDHVSDGDVQRYLQRRNTPAGLRQAIVRQAAGNWLVARLLADLAVDMPAGAGELPNTWQQAYHQELLRAGADDRDHWSTAIRPVLSTLAVAGVGPVLPLPLLCRASGLLGGPDQPARVRDVLVRLRGLVVRGNPGTPDEQAGVFHSTFADYLLAGQDFAVDEHAAHQAIVDAIGELAPMVLAPMGGYDPAEPIHRYAAAAEAEHLWAVGQYELAMRSLERRASPIPVENLARWQRWSQRCQEVLGPEHLASLLARTNVAEWTGNTGHPSEALRLLHRLLPDLKRVLGRDHPETLTARKNIANWTGHAGDAREAVSLLKRLLPDLKRVLGRNDRITLLARGDAARWTGETGSISDALRLSRQLLPDLKRLLGLDDRSTLRTLGNIAAWTGETGSISDALRLSCQLLPRVRRVFGADHPETLAVRNNIAEWTGQLGDPGEALRLFGKLLGDRQRVLGPDHPDTLMTRRNLAAWTAKAGDPDQALRLFSQLLEDQQRVLGPNNRNTQTTKSWIRELKGSRS
jgi:hypothetical protein